MDASRGHPARAPARRARPRRRTDGRRLHAHGAGRPAAARAGVLVRAARSLHVRLRRPRAAGRPPRRGRLRLVDGPRLPDVVLAAALVAHARGRSPALAALVRPRPRPLDRLVRRAAGGPRRSLPPLPPALDRAPRAPPVRGRRRTRLGARLDGQPQRARRRDARVCRAPRSRPRAPRRVAARHVARTRALRRGAPRRRGRPRRDRLPLRARALHGRRPARAPAGTAVAVRSSLRRVARGLQGARLRHERREHVPEPARRAGRLPARPRRAPAGAARGPARPEPLGRVAGAAGVGPCRGLRPRAPLAGRLRGGARTGVAPGSGVSVLGGRHGAFAATRVRHVPHGPAARVRGRGRDGRGRARPRRVAHGRRVRAPPAAAPCRRDERRRPAGAAAPRPRAAAAAPPRPARRLGVDDGLEARGLDPRRPEPSARRRSSSSARRRR